MAPVVSLELAIGRLDEDDLIKSSLRAMRCATSSKHQLKALKTTLESLRADLLDASPDVANVYVPILVELAFAESATFIRCYFNSVKTFPDRVLAVVTAGWAARLRAAEAGGDLSIDDVAALELVSTILAVDEFSAIWREVTEYGLKRVERALDTALREAGRADSVDGAANRFDEAAEKVVEKAASIGYAIVTKRAAPVDRHRSLLGRCVSLAVGAIAAVEEPKVEFVLAQLVGGLGCALVGRADAVDCVLGACFGEGSEVVRVYRSGALGRDSGAHGDEFSAALEPLGARALIVCATMAHVIYGEAVRLRTVPAFSEAFALSICSAVEGEHGHTQFVRLYCVDAISAYLGAYLHAPRDCGDGVDGGDGVHCGEGNRGSGPGAPAPSPPRAVEAVLSQETSKKVMETLALRSLTCDEYVARRITDGFLRVMFEIDAHQARGSAGKPAELAVRTIKVCADMPVSKATFRLWDAILQHVYAPVVLDRHPRLVTETIDAISTNKHDVRAAASSALRNVWKAMSVGAIDRPNSSESHSSTRAMGRFDAAESERLVLDVAAALEAANLRGDGTLDSIITHVLPGLMQSCPESFGLLIRRLHRTEGERSPTPTTRAGTASVASDARPLAAIVGLLSVGKRTGCYADFRDLHRYGIDSFGILREAVVDSREDVRLAALELVCASSVATIDIPPAEELAIVSRYFDAAMLCTSAVAREQNITSFGRLLTRIKLSAAAIITRPQAYDAADHEAVKAAESWMQDICRRCIACLHPGAVYGKKLMAIELLSTSMQVFRELVCEERGHAGDGAYHSGQSGVNKRYQERRGHLAGTGLVYGALRPFPEELYGTSTRDNLLGSLADNFERIRSLAMSITLTLPPNRSSNVRDMLDYAFDYVRRPRLSDQDAGARMMFIVHEQFLVPGTWRVDMRSIDDFDAVSIVDGPTEVSDKEQDTDFVGQLAAVAVDTVPDLSGLGVFLAYLALLRHLVAGSSFSKARDVDTFTKVVHLVEHTVRLIMPVLSRPEENVLGEGVEGGEGGADASASLADLIQSRASDEQLIRCRSWMASREICITIQSLWNAVLPAAHGLFEAGLRATVDALMHVLLRAQHYGSIDSAKATLQHICSTRGGSGALVDATTRSCVDALFDHMLRPDQTRRDAIRRSGGMPFGLQSVMVSGPKSRISSVIMERLLEICESGESGESTGTVGPAIADGRDNAVHWPKVHALNVLRLVYSDPRLSALDRYHGVGFTVVLKSLSDPSWEVQNSAALCFTSLVISKVMGGGAGNVRRVNHVDTWPSRALSAEGFLGRYRDVDQFMIGVLGSGVENSMLAPVLALLGRLKPQSSPPGGTAVGDAGRSLPAPGATATIQRYSECLARHLGSDQIHIRKMAARACVSVVPATSWLELIAVACPPPTAPTSGAITGCSNRLHGQLCLVVEIFKAVYSLSHHADGTHEDLFHTMVASFCGAYRSPTSAPVASLPAPCQAELLKTCIVMCRLASKFRNDQVTSFCAAVVDELWQGVLISPSTSSSPSRSSVPMETVAMKRLVRLNLTWLLPMDDVHEGTGDRTTWVVPFLEYSDRLVQSPVVDVREATLKSILATDIIRKALDSKSARVRDACDRLISTIRRAWEGEEGFYVKILMLQVTNAAGIGADITGWRIHARNPLLLAEIVRSCAYAGADILSAMLAETSLPHQTEEVRAASVEALGIAPALLAPERLDMWTCALTLLVDEEEDIRSHMAHIVDRVIADDPEDRDDPRDARARSHARSRSHTRSRSHGRAEVVQERVFSWLLQQSNGSRATVEWVFGYIVDSPTSLGNVIRDRIASKSDRVLFLVEKANQHEDPIRYAQLAANALKDLGLDLDLAPRLGPDPSAAPWDGLRARGEACARVLHEISCDPAIQALSYGDLQGLRYQTHEAVYRLLLGARVAGISCTVCDEGGQPLFRVDASHN